MKMISLLLLISASTVYAASTKTPAKKPTTPVAAATPAPETAPSAATTIVANPSVAAPAPTPVPWKLSYFGEYIGPRFSNFKLTQTQGPLDPLPGDAAWSHSLKIGYAIASDLVIGAQTRASSPLGGNDGFTFKDERLYFAWKNMIDTSDINMTGVLDVEFPTSVKSKAKGKIVAFNLKNDWTFKTPLRNMSFSALTVVRILSYNILTTQTDVYLALDPTIEWDFAPDWAIIAQANFDASHAYNDPYFSYGQDDPDYIQIGPQWAVNGHVQLYPAIQFFTADFTVPILYFGLSAAL